jgi:hypothetical protein
MFTDKDTIDTLLQTIYNIVAAPDVLTGMRTENSFLSICMPGIPLPVPALDFGFATMTTDQIERAADFSALVNIVPTWGSSWRPSGRLLTGEYFKVIDQPVLPQTQLTDDEKAAYQSAYNLLWVKQHLANPGSGAIDEVVLPSLLVERYNQYKNAYDKQQEDYWIALGDFIKRQNEPGAADIWSQRQPILLRRVRDAQATWESAGKNKVEEAQATVGNLDKRGNQKSWQDRRLRFDQYRRGSQLGDFWLSKYLPAKFWTEPWQTLTLSHNEVHKVDEAEQTSWGGGGGASFGLWKLGAETSYESNKTMASCDLNNFSLSFEITQVPLLRGWLDADVFSSRAWKFDKNLVPDSEWLSNGATPPVGTMPMYPTTMLMVRNVKISFDKSSEVNETFMKQVRASASVGWGPFSARANYYKRTNQINHDFVEDATGLQINGMQVIGFICKLTDKCPNPDPALNWPQ